MEAFSFYGDSRSESHETRRYFQVAATSDDSDDDDDDLQGIEENLSLMSQLYGDSWVLRLYYDLDPADQQLQLQLCDLACSNNNIDLCNVRQLPGTPVADASSMFPMIWRFLPTLDPQVINSYPPFTTSLNVLRR